MNLYKFTHKHLLKNDVQLKQKRWQTTNKKAITQIYWKRKIMLRKKEEEKTTKNINKISHPIKPKKIRNK